MPHYEGSLCKHHGRDESTSLCCMPPGHFFKLFYFTPSVPHVWQVLFSAHFETVTVQLLRQCGACIISVSANRAARRQCLSARRWAQLLLSAVKKIVFWCWRISARQPVGLVLCMPRQSTLWAMYLFALVHRTATVSVRQVLLMSCHLLLVGVTSVQMRSNVVNVPF